MAFYKNVWSQPILGKYYDQLIDRIEDLRGTKKNIGDLWSAAVGDFNGDGHQDIVYFINEMNYGKKNRGYSNAWADDLSAGQRQRSVHGCHEDAR